MPKNLPEKLIQHFPAFRHRNYRLYFLGQLISFTGSWLHGVAHGWLVFQLTHSAFWLGSVSAIAAIPVLFLTLHGGLLVDKFDRKKLLIITQGASLFFALSLGVLTIMHLITLPLLLLLTLLSGIANAIDNPVTQAFVVDVVGKEDLPSAVGLNSMMFNTGRVLGPAVAGFLIALVGVGNIFLINAASFLAILVSLYFIHVQQVPKMKKEKKSLPAIKEGIFYSRSHPLISILLLTAGVGAIFCFSQSTILPTIAVEVFNQGSIGLGRMLSATGVGALVAALIISSQSKKIPAFWLITVGNVLFIFSSLIFTFTHNFTLACICLFFSTLGLTLQFSTIYTTIQRHVKEEFRGRVSSIYVLLFIGFSPIGNLFMGSITSWWGPQLAMRFCLIMTALYGVLILAHLPRAREKFRTFNNKRASVDYSVAKS